MSDNTEALQCAERIERRFEERRETSTLDGVPAAAHIRRLLIEVDELTTVLKATRMEMWRLLDSKGIPPKEIKNWPEILLMDAIITRTEKNIDAQNTDTN